MAGSTTWGGEILIPSFELYELGILNCDGKRGFAAVFGVKWGLNQEIPGLSVENQKLLIPRISKASLEYAKQVSTTPKLA